MPSKTMTPGTGRRRAAMTRAAVLVALLAAIPAGAGRKAADGTLSGTVTAKASGETLAGVEITLRGPDGAHETTTTDRRGRFSIKVPAGDYVIDLGREGYAPFEANLEVQPGVTQVVTVELLDAAAGRRGEAVQLYNAGIRAFEAGDKAAAKASFLAALESDPTLAEPQRVLARIHLEEGAWAAAAQAAEAFLAANPGDDQSERVAYDAYRHLGDPRVAELRRSLGADPGLAKKLAVHAFNEGAIADQQGHAETAERRFREALELDPELAAAHFGLATHQYRTERYEEALASAEKGLELEPASAQGRRLVFISLDAKGDAAAAARALDAYAAVDTAGAVEILFRRGEADFLGGDHDRAREAVAKILQYQPDHPHAHRILGLVYASTDSELAKRHLGRFLELAPDDPESPTVREILAAL
ncbi:MAG: tetratricopeptide repeat protein [Thermoanaerobaculia bacterium]